ncbi:probable WRKY transcription factor 27 [Solanum stenotomum]|uniref:probable WRKY transcription factor 27 n=1 Tax=Solanum stenotomum TaxID=172797 RepID=UPI0020D0E722|nr:probable WRKY transcription factor 27 [Solanum stenotomum]
MVDDDWDVGAVVRSCNINRPDNVVAPKFSNCSPEKPDDQVIIMNQNGNQQLYLHPIQLAQFIQQSSFHPSPTTVACVPPITTTPKEWIDLQQLDIGANNYPNFTFSMETPLIQTRTRKNQSIRITYELFQEELINDIWTWRKYGQKYIKDSPFPRNYYKCSTSKLCEARKKIEKSPNDENIFLVSYSGEHNHDPPTNRRNLASCNSSSKFKLPKGINILPKTSTLNASSSSSKRIKRSRDVASPIIATMPPLEFGSKNEMIVAAVEDTGDGKEEVDMNEDIFMGFK